MLSFFRATNSCSSNPCIPGPHNSTSSPTPKPPGISFSTLSLKSPDPYSPTTPTAASTHYHQVFSPSRLRLGEEPAPEGGLGEGRPSPQEQRGREEAPEAAQEPAEQSSEHSERLSQVIILSFRSDLQWILFCADLPSLIQEGPQCGLVALWMAGTLLAPLSSTPLERLVQVAMERGYTAQGEMFSVTDMGRLAQEALGCQAEVLYGGLGGPNRDHVLQHLVAGHPLLIPYDEDFNHEPCQRKGHKAHWAVSAGVLLGVQGTPSLGYEEDPELPGLFHPAPGTPRQPPSLPEEGSPGAVYLLAKQGKSWHYQLWDYDQVRDSNLQLTDFSPSRAADGREYVVPVGGVRAGLCGQALLLRPQDSGH
ncbi:actin maturation protease isoform X1 [Pseudorca crassidens]|uniref:actin maturation protease isoform X1 n=1 Tax=Pseudorca crassidens TaxID=82174 RepID=UPI00352D5CA4